MLFQYALWLYRTQKLSLGKAAELAGYTWLAFIQKLQADALIIDERMVTKSSDVIATNGTNETQSSVISGLF